MVEIIVIVYMFICICMIFFNAFFIAHERYAEWRLSRRSGAFREEIQAQLLRLKEGAGVSNEHREQLRRRLKRLRFLAAFHEAVEPDLKAGSPCVLRYLRENEEIFIDLAQRYEQKSVSQKAYFAYLMSLYGLGRNSQSDQLANRMVRYAQGESIFCRENALQALYSFGKDVQVAEALRLLSEREVDHSPKLLTDGLLSFQGDQQRLIDRLWKSFYHFSPSIQVAIINYMRLASPDERPRIYEILADDNADKELRLAAARYFGRRVYEPAKEILKRFVCMPPRAEWEYASVAAAALASYPGSGTVDTLKSALSHPAWHVRLNAAQSLSALRVGYFDLVDIYNGDDRYAREILQYKMDRSVLRTSGNAEKGGAVNGAV